MGYLVIIQLHRSDDVHRISSLLLELGLFDASVLESESLEQHSGSLPVLSSLESLFEDRFDYHRTFLVRVANEERVDKLIELAARDGVDFTTPEIGSLTVIPCVRYVGSSDS